MALVIDASITTAWLLDGEATAYTERILDRLANEKAYVPSIWRYEVANALLVSERRGRISQSQTVEAFQRVADLGILTDKDTLSRIWSEAVNFARTFQLSVYDASYIDLAAHRGLPLATLDRNMKRAAERFGVALAADE